MIECRICKEEKSQDCFYKAGGNFNGYRTECKVCVRKRSAAYARLTPEEKAQRQAEKQKKEPWYITNKETHRQRNRDYQQSVHGRAVVIRHKALRRAKCGAENVVSLERIKSALENGVCERTGAKFDLRPHDTYGRNPYAPSIDRIDSFGDYTEDNVQIVCNAYNQGKNQMTDSEFLSFCRQFVQYTDRKENSDALQP